ncbi:MAG: DUF1080 domain-containing protein [Planctomycetes bacterium]|nr:DUF1080 domain-containing protein [Planctomycetota bacterium]
MRRSRKLPAPFAAALALAVVLARAATADAPRGHETLFDALGLDAFVASEEAKAHWRVDGGVLKYDGKDKDLWTARSYRDLVLRLDWRIPGPGPRREVDVILPNGDAAGKVEVQYGSDSGVYLRGSSKSQVNIWNWPIGSGEVYGYRTDRSMPPEVRAGVTPKVRADKPLGEWNTFVIVLKGDRLTVDLNGVTVISRARLPGVPTEGPLALQSHGDPMEFREFYVREIPEGTVDLFDGEGLAGWKAVGAAPDTWSVRDGVLVCSGKPNGYLRTEAAHEGYVLEGEWRFPGKGGSTGLLLHTQGPDKVWPSSIEIQTDHTHVGNFVKIGDAKYEGGRRSEDLERPVGQWNHFEAVCRGDTIECYVNGKKASEARKCSPTRGTIGFQSEGVEVHLRNIWLRPLKP